jgi:hypothetical protein
MSEKPGHTGPNILEAMEREKARLLAQAAAVDRDMAEISRLAAKYNLTVAPAGSTPIVPAGPSLPAPQSMSDLIHVYRTAQNSPYQKLTHASRTHYNALLGLIAADHSAALLSDLTVEDFVKWHQAWSEGGKLAVAFAKIAMVRGLFGFGTEVLHDKECERLFGILCKLRFRAPEARTERLTVKQANDIRAKAREMERPSIALAQAFQSGLGLLQKDVIGEWVPLSESGVSDFTANGLKWLRGIRWSEIDDDLILKHTSWQEEIELNLKDSPMVLDELRVQFGFNIEKDSRSSLPSSGPIVISEWDKLPWTAPEFRRWWRKVADACKIPKAVRNMDSRSKAHNEAAEDDQVTENISGGILE